MEVFDVLSRRPDEDWTLVGSIKAPDRDFAMHLARESHFRHGEGETFALRRRGEEEIVECPDPTGIGGVIDRSYRRQDGYVGVGAKLKRVQKLMASRGLVVDRPRPGSRVAGSESEEPRHA